MISTTNIAAVAARAATVRVAPTPMNFTASAATTRMTGTSTKGRTEREVEDEAMAKVPFA